MISIYIDIVFGDLDIDTIKENLFKVEFSNQDRSDVTKPSWGLKSNSGYVEFYDVSNLIKKINKKSDITTIPIFVYVLNNDKKVFTGKYYITSATYDIKKAVSRIEFKDGIETLQNQTAKVQYITPPKSCYDLLESVCEDNDVTIYYADTLTESRLRDITIAYPILDSGSVWAQLTKICELTMCYISCGSYGDYYIKYDGGR
jgi:hypothetical protein